MKYQLEIPGGFEADSEMQAIAERIASRISAMGGVVHGTRGMRIPDTDHRAADVIFDYEGRPRQLRWSSPSNEPVDDQVKELMSSPD